VSQAEDAPTKYYDEPISIYDFSSQYPSAQIRHNLSPDVFLCAHEDCKQNNKIPQEIMDEVNATLPKDEVVGLDGRKHKVEQSPRPIHYWSCMHTDGIMRTLLRKFKEEKDKASKEGNYARRSAWKIIINSGYGIYGDTSFPWYDYRLAESITGWGRYYLKQLIDIAEGKQFQFKHIYHDTDSVFLTGITTEEQDQQFRKAVIEQIGEDMPVGEVENLRAILIKGPKRYIKFPKDPSEPYVIKGLEGKKGNTPQFIRDSFTRFVDHLDKRDITIPEIIAEVKRDYELLKAGLVDADLLVRKLTLTKDPDQFEDSLAQNYVGKPLGLKRGEVLEMWYTKEEVTTTTKKGKINKKIKDRYTADKTKIVYDKYLESFTTVFEKCVEALDGYSFAKDILGKEEEIQVKNMLTKYF
jgi:DNA polymerase, archaea type